MGDGAAPFDGWRQLQDQATPDWVLLERAYRVLLAAQRGGADWDVWAEVGAEAVLADLGARLWPNGTPDEDRDPDA